MVEDDIGLSNGIVLILMGVCILLIALYLYEHTREYPRL